MRVSGQATHLSFRHCTFDGGLAPWTTRTEAKTSYDYYSTYFGPDDPRNEVRTNHLANKTIDILVINDASDAEYAYCTFRHTHDGIKIRGLRVDFHHCLFEDVNDEVV